MTTWCLDDYEYFSAPQDGCYFIPGLLSETGVDESWRPYACVIVAQRSWVRIPFRPEFFF